MSGAKTPAVELPPESETYPPFAHVLRVVVVPSGASGPKVRVRVFCTHCGHAAYDDEWPRTCGPEIPRVSTRLSDGLQWGAK